MLRRHASARRVAMAVAVVVWAACWPAMATDIVVKDGRTLSGTHAMVGTLADNPRTTLKNPEGPLQTIVMVYDELRRVYVSQRLVREVRVPERQEQPEKFRLRQRILRGGAAVKSVGPAMRIQPFDEFGRRIFTMYTAQGPVDVVQGITDLTPQWAKVEGLSHLWDMRIATSSIPRDVLSKILYKQIEPTDIEHRKKVARFYLQAERYEEAAQELESMLKDFPDPAVKSQLEPSVRAVRQLAAQRLLRELQLRRDAGQHQLVERAVKNFPAEGVPGEVLQAVREMQDSCQALEARRQLALKKLDEQLGKVGDAALRKQAQAIRDEIAAELNSNTLGRMAPFLQNADDAELPPAEKVALSLSSCLLGNDASITSLPAAVSAWRVRAMVERYINEPVKLNRTGILGEMTSEEAASPPMVAAILANAKAPTPPNNDPTRQGFFEFQVPGLAKEPPVAYQVQLPPEYDPHRFYPTILSLHGEGMTPAHQIDWWAGSADAKGVRTGQAGRHGYIVIAPAWTLEHQSAYRYSAREHAAVLDCLRDACRRFAIDADRVFLSGHSIGGDAAWDLGLAHPDLWAGVIPIVAKADRYIAHYWENAEWVPFYFVGGELDESKMLVNAGQFDRYLKRGFPCTVVDYQGRGHEDFYDEILRLFDWMGRYHRDFYPRAFNCSAMRRWDNFFWWAEITSFPPGTVVEPSDWPARNPQTFQIKGTTGANNNLGLRCGSATLNIWLAPKQVDFAQRINLVLNGKRVSVNRGAADPSLAVLLEDVRTRGDRQNPFWAKVEIAGGRVIEER